MPEAAAELLFQIISGRAERASVIEYRFRRTRVALRAPQGFAPARGQREDSPEGGAK